VASWRREPARLSRRWLAYRQVAGAWPALWHPGPPNSPTRQPSARWHERPAGQLAQYLSLAADGAWAELVRYENLRTDQDRLDFRRRLWACAVDEQAIAALGSFSEIEACGLDPARVVDDDQTGARALADELRAHGYRGLLSPSAALDGSVNLTLFGGRREIEHDAPILARAGNPRPQEYLVVQLLADDAAAPPRLLRRTRRWGDRHLGLEAWQSRSIGR
jgi:hypothetical protein